MLTSRARSRAQMQSMLANDSQQLHGHTAWPFGAAFPLLDGAFAGVEVASKYRLANVIALATFLICCGPNSRGARTHVASKLRMVALSIAPILHGAEAE